MTEFTKVVLYTGADGRAQFRDEPVALDEGTPQSMLSALFPSGGMQLRHSPVGFRSQFHCSPIRNGCSSWAARWRSACRTARHASSGRESISIPPTCFPRAPFSMRRCTGTGAGKQALIR